MANNNEALDEFCKEHMPELSNFPRCHQCGLPIFNRGKRKKISHVNPNAETLFFCSKDCHCAWINEQQKKAELGLE